GVFSEFDLNGKTAGAVSVGKADKLRQIINVGDATEDTDAVNLRQLKAVKDSLNTTITENSVHYYSAKSDKQAAGSNYANDGAKAADSMVIGINSSSEGVNSTVLGNNNKLTGVKNPSAPWNNSIVVGQNIEVEGVNNAVFATDYHNYDNKLTKVFGEQNTVLGVGNLVGYTAVQNGTEWEYTKKGIGSDQNVAVGMTNTVNGGSVVVGTSSEADDLGTSIGHGNAIIGMNDGGGQRGVALGNDLKVKGEEAVAIGNESEAVSDWSIAMGSKSKARGVYSLAIGKDSVAEKDFATAVGFGAKANLENSVALGSWSIASTDKGMAGYDPATKAASTDASATWKSTAAAVSVGDKAQGITRQITNVAAGTEDTDAVNVAQLKKLQETVNNTAGEAAKHSTVVAGDYVQVVEGTNAAGGKEYTISGPQLTSADGTVKITDKVENGKKVGYNLSVDTSAISGEISKGMNFAGDTGAAVNKKLGETLAIKGGATELTEGNIGVEAKDGALNVKLAKNVKGVETLEVKEKITVGETVIGKDSVTTKEIKAGDTTVNNDGMKINNGPSITKDNVDMNNQQIHNVKEGTASSDAATVGQVRNITDRLGGRVDKVGAGAAALAALHPVDFDADDKLDIAAGWGNYRGENALALGAFYRPDERTLFSIGGTFGNGENMVNAGFTFKLDRRAENGGIRPITSKAALVKEVKLLRTDNEALRKDNEEIKKNNMEMRERMQRMEEQLAQLLKK
ncbi:MAG: YadA-like family protein, partial [Acidaminococcaceae bacterium]|nr:YadA-like family protein [Acidaminococcaceae bacterium]